MADQKTMNCQLWENTIVAWVNSVRKSKTPIRNVSQLKTSLGDVISLLDANSSSKNLLDFLKETYPNYFKATDSHSISSNFELLCAASACLIYVTFSGKSEFEPVKQSMCEELDNRFQVNIANFLISVQKHGDVFEITQQIIEKEIFQISNARVTTPTMSIGDGVNTTPVKGSKGCDSPLQGFFQTPKRKPSSRENKTSCSLCCDGDRIKKLKEQLVEEETEKSILQEQLQNQNQKCSELESNLKRKIEEMKRLKHEWDEDSIRNEDKFDSLRGVIKETTEKEKKLKSEISYLEEFVTKLEGESSKLRKEKEKAEAQLNTALQQLTQFQAKSREASEEITELRLKVSELEAELSNVRENAFHSRINESMNESSFIDRSFEPVQENMGVVIEKLLREKTDENAALIESVNELKTENKTLKNRISELEKLTRIQNEEKFELKKLNSELYFKLEEFDRIRAELEATKSELIASNQEIDSLNREKSELIQKIQNLSITLTDRENELSDCKESNKQLKIDILKLTEEFRSAQKKLEEELKTVSKLTAETEEKHLQLQKSMETLTEIKSEHEMARKSLEYVENQISKNLGKLGNLVRDSESSDFSVDSFSSCFSVENKVDKLTCLLEKLEIHNVETAESRAALEQTCMQLNENIAQLRKDVAELEEEQKKSVKQKLHLEECIRMTEAKLTELQESYSFRIEKLKEELEEKISKMKELNDFLEKSVQNQKNLQEEKENLSTELTTLMRESSIAKETIRNLEDQLSAQKTDHSVVMTEMTGELSRLKKDIEVLNDNNQSLKNLVDVNERKLTESYDEILIHKKSLRDKEVDLNDAKLALENMKMKLTKIEDELEATMSEKTEMIKFQELETKRNRELLSEKNSEIETLIRSRGSLELRVEELVTELTSARDELEKLKTSREELKIEFNDAISLERDTICQLNIRIATLEQKLSQVENEKMEANLKIKDISVKLEMKNEEHRKLQAEKQEIETYYQDKLTELDRIEKELKTLKTKYSELIKENEDREIQLQKMTKTKFELEKNVRMTEIQNRELSCELEIANRELERLKLRNEALSSENLNHSQNLEKQKKEMECLNEHLTSVQERCAILEAEKEKVSTELTEARTELQTTSRELSEMLSAQKVALSEARAQIARSESELGELEKLRSDLMARLEDKSSENEKVSEELRKVSDRLQEEIDKRNLVETKLNEEKLSVVSLTTEVEELESQRDKIAKMGQEMKSNMGVLKTLLFKMAPLEQKNELEVIYDSYREIAESVSQFSVEDMENMEEHDDYSISSETRASSGVDVGDRNNDYVEIEMEELNREIILAKRSLVAFLQASTKHFEVLKIKENLIDEMSQQQQNLENRITSLTELNTRLTKEILESKNISKIESESKEQQLESLRSEVESLNKASGLLKEKLTELEKLNEILIEKKEENLKEIDSLREENKSLMSKLQNRMTAQLKQQDSCWGLIEREKKMESELENVIEMKDEVEKRINDLRKEISKHENKVALEIMLSAAEQKFYVASQKLVQIMYSCLKWAEKNIERQCMLMGRGDDAFDGESHDDFMKNEQDVIMEKLKSTNLMLNGVKENLQDIEIKSQESLSDSLDEIPVGNKTFDIVSIDEPGINNRTFSINTCTKEFPVPKDNFKIATAWTLSPPSKTAPKLPPRPAKREKAQTQGSSWTIPFQPAVPKKEKPIYRSNVELSKVPEKKPLTKSSSVAEIEYSPPNRDSKSSVASSFMSAVDEIDFKKESNRPIKTEGESIRTDFLTEERKTLERKLWNLQKENLERLKEIEQLKSNLQELKEKRKEEKDYYEKNQESVKKEITRRFEERLEDLKRKMNTLYDTELDKQRKIESKKNEELLEQNRELMKHKSEQIKIISELREQNKAYKEHIDELRNQHWQVSDKFLEEQKLNRELERKLSELRTKYEKSAFLTDHDSKTSHASDFLPTKEGAEENGRMFPPRSAFPTIPTEDEDLVFDNRCLEDMKAGFCKVEGPEGRLTELQYRNSLCLPHLKTSYPAETQIYNPKLFKDGDLKFGHLAFGHESQSLTDSDHSMTKSLLPEDKTRKKEQTSYHRPGPPTPSKNGGRLSIQSGDFRLTPRSILKESNEMTKGTPSRLMSLFTSRSSKRESLGRKDENSAPVTPRGKKNRLFRPRKPFGVRDN